MIKNEKKTSFLEYTKEIVKKYEHDILQHQISWENLNFVKDKFTKNENNQ